MLANDQRDAQLRTCYQILQSRRFAHVVDRPHPNPEQRIPSLPVDVHAGPDDRGEIGLHLFRPLASRKRAGLEVDFCLRSEGISRQR